MRCSCFFSGHRCGVAIAILSFYILGAAATIAAGYLKIPDIPGESQAADHEDDIDVFGIDWGISVDSGTGPGGASPPPSFKHMSFTKGIDKATPLLMLHCASGQALSEVEFFMDDSGATPFRKLYVKLENALVVSAAVTGALEDGALSEQVSFAYQRITFEYIEQTPDGSAGDSVEFGWDLVADREL